MDFSVGLVARARSVLEYPFLGVTRKVKGSIVTGQHVQVTIALATFSIIDASLERPLWSYLVTS